MLRHEFECEATGGFFQERVAYPFGTMAHNDNGSFKMKLVERIEDVQHHRPPTQTVDGLRSGGPHSASLTGRHDHCRQWATGY